MHKVDNLIELITSKHIFWAYLSLFFFQNFEPLLRLLLLKSILIKYGYLIKINFENFKVLS